MENMNCVHPGAKIAAGVQIGPFTCIAEHVEIGEGCQIANNVTIMDYVKIGKNCHIFPGAVIGAVPQDLKFAGEESHVVIGDNVTIRECVTINRGTAASGNGVTRVGDHTLIMSYVHIAHDCTVGNHCILTSYVGIAGETVIQDWAIIGGASAAHQFSHIGAHAMLAGGSMIAKDVPPYVLAGRRPLCYCGINVIGLRRRGFTNQQIESIHNIYRVIYQDGLNISDACRKIEEIFEPGTERDTILDFVRSSKRGIIPMRSVRHDDDDE